MNVLSLFDGMSCGQLALKKAEIDVNAYLASEIDQYAIKVTRKNFTSTIHIGDIKNVKGYQGIDLLLAGSPCTDLSRLKTDRKNFEGEQSSLIFDFFRIFENSNPKYFLLENVVMDKECEDYISERLGIQPVLINSDLFVQQNRPRLYWTNIPIKELPKRPDWDYHYYQYRRTYWRENKSGVCPCLTANMGTGGNNVPYILDNDEKRVLTVNELEELQTVPKDYTGGVSNTQRKKMIGNGWTVDVISHILKGLKEEISKNKASA
jgi:site-specific DNA-cytosine methylase